MEEAGNEAAQPMESAEPTPATPQLDEKAEAPAETAQPPAQTGEEQPPAQTSQPTKEGQPEEPSRVDVSEKKDEEPVEGEEKKEEEKKGEGDEDEEESGSAGEGGVKKPKEILPRRMGPAIMGLGGKRTFRIPVGYIYTRPTKEFGRPLTLRAVAPRLMVHIPPSRKQRLTHKRLHPSPGYTQTEHPMSIQMVLTDMIPYNKRNQGHVEGGYPHEVNRADLDLLVRYKRKLEKDEGLLKTLPILHQRVDRAVSQNNMIDIYSDYFLPPEYAEVPPPEKVFVRTVNSYRDAWTTKRPVVDLSWEPIDAERIAVAHSFLQFQRYDCTKDIYSFIWNLSQFPNFHYLIGLLN